jgi:hypothetical protein
MVHKGSGRKVLGKEGGRGIGNVVRESVAVYVPRENNE